MSSLEMAEGQVRADADVLSQVGHAEGEKSGEAGAGAAAVGAGERGHRQHEQLQQLPASPQQHPLLRGHSPPHGKNTTNTLNCFLS